MTKIHEIQITTTWIEVDQKKTQVGHTNLFVQVNEIALIKRGKIKEKI
jgi:hypothetical protein